MMRKSSPGIQRFVILAPGRSRSSLLFHLLKNQRCLLIHHEPFHRRAIYVETAHLSQLGIADAGNTQSRDADPIAFCQRLFDTFSDSVRCVGFKLLMDHDVRVLRHVIRRPDVKKVLLRRNPLFSFSSLAIADKTVRWNSQLGKPQWTEAPAIEPARFLAYCREVEKFERRIDRARRSSPEMFLTVYSEDLCAGAPVDGLAMVCEFLNIPVPEQRMVPIRPQNTLELAARIQNYATVMEALADTPYASIPRVDIHADNPKFHEHSRGRPAMGVQEHELDRRVLAWPEYRDGSELDDLFRRYGRILAGWPRVKLVLLRDERVDESHERVVTRLREAHSRALGPGRELEVSLLERQMAEEDWRQTAGTFTCFLALRSTQEPPRRPRMKDVTAPVVWTQAELVQRLHAESGGAAAASAKPVQGHARKYSLCRGVASLIERQVELHPDRPAVLCNGETLSYRELNARANRWATGLRAAGMEADRIVALEGRRDVDTVVAILAVLKAGGAYMPLDRRYPARRRAAMVRTQGVRLLLTHDAPDFDAADLPVTSLADLDRDTACESPADVQADLHEEHLAYVPFTSGSTGEPKAIGVTHRGIVNLLNWAHETYSPEDLELVLASSPLAFDLSVFELFVPLSAGGSVVISDSLLELLHLPERERVTLINTVPSAMEEYLRNASLPRSLRVVNFAGELLSTKLVREVHAQSGVRCVLDLYGPAEATTYTTCGLRRADEAAHIGRPIANMSVRILDQNGCPVPEGEPGELAITGPGVARGYLGRPDLTAASFLPDPDSPGSRMYVTGDLVQWTREGQLRFLGRLDNQVKLRGFRIELEEIDRVLREHPRVREVATAVCRSPSGRRQLVAFLVPELRGEARDSSEALADWETLWDRTYWNARRSQGHDAAVAGYVDSYSGALITPEQAEEWISCSAGRVRQLGGTRILEIGCGTGMLLRRLAPGCQSYVGIDTSVASLEDLQRHVQAVPELADRVRLIHARADQLDRVAGESFDVVVLNGVIQYFPDEHYLTRVIGECTRFLGERGTLYLGDVRNRALVTTFHCSRRLRTRRKQEAIPALRDAVLRDVEMETELTVDPAFFLERVGVGTGFRSITFLLRRGILHDEATRFRYDAILHRSAPHDAHDWEHVDGACLDRAPAELEQLLGRKSSRFLLIRNVPNQRLLADVAAWCQVRDGPPPRFTGEVVARVGELDVQGVDPEDLWALARHLGRSIGISPSTEHPDGMDIVVVPEGVLDGGGEMLRLAPEGFRGVLRSTSTTPSGSALAGDLPLLRQEIRQYLRDRLPEHLVPRCLTVVPSLPRSPNGKINRALLPAPLWPSATRPFAPPVSDLERKLVGLFEEFLELPEVGVDDDFFDLGGDSLLAVRVARGISQATGLDVSFRLLTDYPTVRRLARRIEEGPGLAEHQCLVPLQPEGSCTPLYFCHAVGGHVMRYRQLAVHCGPDLPFYGLRYPELDSSPLLPLTVAEMARRYLREIRLVQPHGPYAVGGFCSGALIGLELARQLTAQGEEVAVLVIVDYAPIGQGTSPWKELASAAQISRDWTGAAMIRRLQRLASPEEASLDRHMKELQRRLVEIWRAMQYRYFSAAKRPLPGSLRRVGSILAFAEHSYRPPIVPAKKVLLFATSEGLDARWTPLVDAMETHYFRASHLDILRSQYAREIAQVLKAALQQVE